jgi:hypothetical protein
MIPRLFVLVNGQNETYDITSTDALFHEPTGLGYQKTNTYHRIGKRYILIDSVLEQPTISGKIAFAGEYPYESYSSFINFCQYEPLILEYTPDIEGAPYGFTSSTTYRMPVAISKIEKTEIEEQGYLDVGIEFHGLSPWYKYVDLNNDDDQNPIPPLIWGIKWGVQFKSDPLFKSGIYSDAPSNSPARFTIYGPITNPKWEHYVNGELVETGAFSEDFSLGEGEELVIDNTEPPYTITKFSGDVAEDVYQKTDFTTKRFISIMPGLNTIRILDSDDEAYYNARLEAYLYYDTV